MVVVDQPSRRDGFQAVDILALLALDFCPVVSLRVCRVVNLQRTVHAQPFRTVFSRCGESRHRGNSPGIRHAVGIGKVEGIALVAVASHPAHGVALRTLTVGIGDNGLAPQILAILHCRDDRICKRGVRGLCGVVCHRIRHGSACHLHAVPVRSAITDAHGTGLRAVGISDNGHHIEIVSFCHLGAGRRGRGGDLAPVDTVVGG